MKTAQRGWCLAIVMVLASACASAQPSRSVVPANVKELAGRWSGRLDVTSGPPRQHLFIIRDDGTFHETATGALESQGSLEIRDGVAIFTGSSSRGQLRLFEEGAERLLVGEGEITQGFIRTYTGLGGGRYAVRLKLIR